jgi:hypothetical protein
MSAAWDIRHWPEPSFHTFLSHCAEDREPLIWRIHERLQELRLMPWFDQRDYPLAQDPFHALRNQLIRCRHIIYFITPAYLRQGRGWVAAERTYAELIQRHFDVQSTSWWSFELPLIFLPNKPESLDHLQRSAWSTLIPRAVWYDRRRLRRQSRVEWAADQIVKLVASQYADSQLFAHRLLNDPDMVQRLDQSMGLRNRLTSAFPRFMPPAT